MSTLEFHGIDIGLVEGATDLVGRILDANADLRDGDVLVIASKVVSLAEGRYVHLDDIDPSGRADRIADETGIDPREVELILRDSTVVGAIPIDEIGRDLLETYARDRESADAALETLPSLLLTIRNGRLCTNAGVDLSNSPEGVATLLPADPDASAKRLRAEIRDRADAEVAVLLSDSEVSIRGGSIDVAVGCSGIDPVDRQFGSDDLFGEPTVGGVDLVGDELCSGAALLAGQTDERTPVVLVRGLEYESGQGVGGNADLLRPGLTSTLVHSARVVAAKRLPWL